MAFGVFQIRSKLLVWRYLFLIEGACSVLFSIFAFWYLPRSAAEAKFLGEEEKSLAFHRMQVDSSSVVQEEFNFRDSIKIFTYPTTYCFLLIEICLGVPIQSVALFMPQIIQRLGYGLVKTNLYTGEHWLTVSWAASQLTSRHQLRPTSVAPSCCSSSRSAPICYASGFPSS